MDALLETNEAKRAADEKLQRAIKTIQDIIYKNNCTDIF